MNQKNQLNYERILNHIKQEKIFPVYLFFGDENYLKESILNKFRDKLVDYNYRELNYRVFYGGKVLMAEIINEVETIPFVSKYKLVVIKEAENISKEDKERLIDYLNRHNFKNYFSTLLIIYKKNIPDQELVKSIKKTGMVVNFSIPDKSKLSIWIRSKFQQSNKKITPEALFYLQSMIGSDLRRLFNEIEKIDIYMKDIKVVEKEDIMMAIGGSESINIFKVLDSIGEKKINNAIDGLVKLDKSNLHYLSIFAMIYRQIRLILQTKLLLVDKADSNQIKRELKLPSFIIEKIIKQSKKYTFKELCQSYKLLNIADLELKDSQKNPHIILEELVMNIINQKISR